MRWASVSVLETLLPFLRSLAAFSTRFLAILPHRHLVTRLLVKPYNGEN